MKPDLYTMQERLRGYSFPVAKLGKEAIVETISNRADAMDILKRHLAGGGPPFAIFASNHLTARYICEATQVLGVSIPSQFAILSFDDFDLADTLTPPMSVVQQPVEELGRAAAKLLFEAMAGWKNRLRTERHQPAQLSARLMIRESCGCHAGFAGSIEVPRPLRS